MIRGGGDRYLHVCIRCISSNTYEFISQLYRRRSKQEMIDLSASHHPFRDLEHLHISAQLRLLYRADLRTGHAPRSGGRSTRRPAHTAGCTRASRKSTLASPRFPARLARCGSNDFPVKIRTALLDRKKDPRSPERLSRVSSVIMI